MATELTPEKLAKLRELAKAADPYLMNEPWVYSGGVEPMVFIGVSVVVCDIADNGDSEIADAFGRHIAAADPQTVLALVEEVERLRKENGYWMEECYHQQAKAERLQARVAELETVMAQRMGVYAEPKGERQVGS